MIHNLFYNMIENRLNVNINGPSHTIIQYTFVKVGLSKSVIALILLFL